MIYVITTGGVQNASSVFLRARRLNMLKFPLQEASMM